MYGTVECNYVMDKVKEILRGQLTGYEEIELLESVHRNVVHPRKQPGGTLDSERISNFSSTSLSTSDQRGKFQIL